MIETKFAVVTFSGLTVRLTSEANHRGNPNYPNQWAAAGVAESGEHTNHFGVAGDIAAGDRVTVVYDFSHNEVVAAGNDASNLPWDDEHVYAVLPS